MSESFIKTEPMRTVNGEQWTMNWCNKNNKKKEGKKKIASGEKNHKGVEQERERVHEK